MGVISSAKEREPMLTGKEIKRYTVWVDGEKITPKFVTYTTAKTLLSTFELEGYRDVVITGAKP